MVEKETVRRGYDEVAGTYAAERSADGRERAILTQFLQSVSDTARVLDAGCGVGTPILSRRPAARETIGIDLSRTQLRRAAEGKTPRALLQGDMARLPLAASSVDAVIALHSVIHVPADDHQRTIDEFARVLRPEGRLLLTEGPGEWSGTNPNWLGTDATMAWSIAGADTTRQQLRAAGFDIRREWTAPDELGGDRSTWVYVAAELGS